MGKSGNNYAYIDGTNLHNGVESLGWKLDYRKFRILLKDRYGVTKAYLFMGFVPLYSTLYRNLQTAGYILVFKQTILNPDGEVKGNCDGELILQAAGDFYENQFEQAVIVSGDGDFACLASFLLEKRRLEAVLSPSHEKCSLLLKRSGAKITFIEELRDKVEYRK